MKFIPGTALPAPSDSRIAWFENTYRVRLPDDYVSILQSGNGAIPEHRMFVQGAKERLIERMLCLLDNPQGDNVNGWYDLTAVMAQLDSRLVSDENLVGMNVIPVAELFGGDFLCLDFRAAPEAPVVAVWDHEQSDDFQPVLQTIAPSMTALSQLLR